MTEPLPDEIDEALWEEACRRAAAIRQFRKRTSGQSTVAAIADLASELGLSQACQSASNLDPVSASKIDPLALSWPGVA